MKSIDDLFAAVRQFKLFSQVQSTLLNVATSLKSKVWTLEILTRHLNEVIEKFLSSDFDYIEAFFAAFIGEKFGKDSVAKQKFCYTLLMSISIFEQNHRYIKLYAKLLGTESDYALYHCFWELKDMILDIKGVLNRSFANLDHLYLNEKHWQLVLSSLLDYDCNQILDFRKQMQSKSHNIRREGKSERILQFSRNDEYCASFFIKEVLARFHEAHILEKLNANVIESYAGPALDRKTTLQRGQYNSMIERMSKMRNTRMSGLNPSAIHASELVNAKSLEKERLIAEIKQTTQLANAYKQSAICMASYVEQVDPILIEYQKDIRKMVKSMQEIAVRNITGANLAKFKAQVSDLDADLMESGSSINVMNAKKLKRSLLGTDGRTYKHFEERLKDCRPTLKKIIGNLKATIFSRDFNLANDSQGQKVEALRTKIDNLFGHFSSLENSDVMIIDTFFQNLDQEKGSVSADLLSQVLGKIDRSIKKGLNEEDKAEVPIESDQLEQAIKNSFKADFERLESLRKETAPWQETVDPEFRKNRYSTKPLNEQAPKPVRESLIEVEKPTDKGSFKPTFLNFSKSKTLNADFEHIDRHSPNSSTDGLQIPKNNGSNANHLSSNLGQEDPVPVRSSNIEAVKGIAEQPSLTKTANLTYSEENKADRQSTPVRQSSNLAQTNANFKKKASEGEPTVIDNKMTGTQKDTQLRKPQKESDVVKPLQPTNPSDDSKKHGSSFNAPPNTSKKNNFHSNLNRDRDNSAQTNLNPPFEAKITAIKKPRNDRDPRESDLSFEDKQDATDEPLRERPSLRLTISRLSKLGSDRDSIKRVSVKKELSQIAIPRNQSVMDGIPEFLTKSDVGEQMEKGQKGDRMSNKYNSNVPLMQSKEGVMFAQEIGLIDEQPKTIKNFFSNFWGKK